MTEGLGPARPAPRRSRIRYSTVAAVLFGIIAVYLIGYLRTSDAARQQSTASANRGDGVYHDGSYTGRGVSRHGDIVVQVAIQGGRIAAVDVDHCGTQYSCSLVDRLRREAVTAQAVPVDVVSRATDSSFAMRGAIAAALDQAE